MLYILETHAEFINVYDSPPNTPERRWWGPLTIFSHAIFHADSKRSASRENREFGHNVSQALSEGKDIILVAKDKNDIDKRLRTQATIFSLPARK